MEVSYNGGVPQNAWCALETPSKEDVEGTPIFSERADQPWGNLRKTNELRISSTEIVDGTSCTTAPPLWMLETGGFLHPKYDNLMA